MLKYVIILHFVARIFAWYYLKHYLCNILVFFVRKRLRIKMGQMVTERGNHLFLYTFHSKIHSKITGVIALLFTYVHQLVATLISTSLNTCLQIKNHTLRA